MVKTIVRVILAIALVLALYTYIKVKSWEKLEKEFATFYEQDRYTEATTIAQGQLKVAGEIPFFAKFYIPPSLNNLGRIYHARGKYAEAEPYYKLSLKMAESALGENNIKLTVILENMAKFYKELGNEEEAQKLLKRIEAIKAANP